MNGNGDFFDNGNLDMHRNMLHNWNVLIYRNRLDVMMVDVVSVDIVRNMNDNVFTARHSTATTARQEQAMQ